MSVLANAVGLYSLGKNIYDNRANIGNAIKTSLKPDTSFNDDLGKWLKEFKANQVKTAPLPKLAQFDVLANWRNAQSAAERAVNPRYELKLNQFLANVGNRKEIKQQQFNLGNENIELAKAQALEDSATSRVRTAEDVAGAIEKIDTQEGNFQVDEGRDFDTNYRQTAEALAAEGAGSTGLGRQTAGDMIKLRNITSQRQLDEFNGQREAKQIFKDRTFDDLARGDERATKLAENNKKAAQFDMDAYLEDLARETEVFKDTNESQRLQEVFNATKNEEKLGVENFLASLAGRGLSAADIAYNRQTYAR